jgi:hypothetical protein
MASVLAKEFIDEQIAGTYRDMLPAALRTAYAGVKALADKTDFLKIPTAEFARGHLIAWGAEFEVFRLIRDGHWPFDCEWVQYTKPTGYYLRIDTGEAFVTVSQLADVREGPRFAKFRRNAGLGNYPLLPFDEFAREAAEHDRKHLVIGHGYQQLDFVIIGAPKPKSKFWIDRTENLLGKSIPAADHDASAQDNTEASPGVPEEGADIKIDLELSEHLQQRIRDSNG